jgi:hypothetical protein
VRIFFSHSTRDRDLASALKTLLKEFFGEGPLEIDFSSDQDAGGGIPPGAQWLPWIREHIELADRTYVLITPNSVAKPWVLWEAGAAAGVALALNKQSPVVPITFGVEDADIPSPLSSGQRIRGDTDGANGIPRLLTELNRDLGEPLSPLAFAAAVKPCYTAYAGKVTAAMTQSAPLETLLASVPNQFPVSQLAGLWVTCYRIGSGQRARCHADIALITPESDRRVRIRNCPPEPRTDGHAEGFRNEIEAELVTRHLIGHWKNLSDTRYFGALQLAVLPGDDVMDGQYTSLESDIKVGVGRWRWVRLAGSAGEDELRRLTLKAPGTVLALVRKHGYNAGPLRLADVTENA